MKIELMKSIVDTMNDEEMTKNIMAKMPNSSDKEIIMLIDELKKCDCNEFAYYLAVSPVVQKNRRVEEIILLMKVLKKCDYNEIIYKLLINADVQKNRTIEEIIILIETLKKCDYNTHVYSFVTNPIVHGNKSEEEIYNINIYPETEQVVREKITIEEIKMLAETIKKHDFNETKSDIKDNTQVAKYTLKNK